MQTPLNRATLSTVLFAASIALTTPALAQIETQPIVGSATSTGLSGTVTVVNQEKRMLTIETPDGHFEVLHVPDSVTRLDQVKIGNLLTITQTEAVLVDLIKGPGTAGVGRSQETLIEPDPGMKPSGAIVDTLSLRGVVESVDKAESTVTIRGPSRTLTFDVSDPALLETLAPGDGVEASYMRVVSGEFSFQ